ncbi:MAG TPA: hypothetical protein VGK74_26740 [Symbiobacteriaceae bacterium]|jgi:L-threonine kinase
MALEAPPPDRGDFWQIGRGESFGTFGELLQGVLLEENLDFLVTFPIQAFSRATFVPEPGGRVVSVQPPDKVKSHLMTQIILGHFGVKCGGCLTLQSDLPVGKGLASSSADLVATARALAAAFQLDIPVELLQRFMHQIEPSDGVMYPGVVAFYHRKVQLRQYIGQLPALTVVSIDEGGQVDTIEFNRIPKPFNEAEKLEYRQLLDELDKAIRDQDVRAIGRVATRSAALNQKLRPKQMLDDVGMVARDVDALGVAVAHSGTCLGVLLSPEEPDYADKLTLTRKLLGQLSDTVTVYHSLRMA